jgi:hypothetical protein
VAALDDLRGLADSIRGTVPQALGLRTTRVIVRTREWSGGKTGLGDATVTDYEVAPRPLVREVHGDSELRVGPITPSYSGCAVGGVAYSDLLSDDGCGVERYVVVIGANGERQYRITSIDTSHDLSWYLQLSTFERALPF